MSSGFMCLLYQKRDFQASFPWRDLSSYKYSSYLPHEYKKVLKRIALESDRNEYDVLIEVVGQYLTQQKQPK
jgi:hypothetical protein